MVKDAGAWVAVAGLVLPNPGPGSLPTQDGARELRDAALAAAARGDRAEALRQVRALVARDPRIAAGVMKDPRIATQFYEGRPLVSLEPAQIRVKARPPLPLAPPLLRHRAVVILVELVVDADGLPLRAEALDGPRDLWPAAEAYAVQWMLEPLSPPSLARLLVLIPFQGEGGAPPAFRSYEGPQEPLGTPPFRRKL